MSLTSVEFRQYRAFPSGRIVIRPLTIFFGYNSSGKSALLRLLPTIAALSSKLRKNPSLGQFQSTPSKLSTDFAQMENKASSEPMTLTLNWTTQTGDPVSAVFVIREMLVWKLHTHIVETLLLTSPLLKAPIELRWSPPEGMSSEKKLKNGQYSLLIPGSPEAVIGTASVYFSRLALFPQTIEMNGNSPISANDVSNILNLLAEELRQISEGCFWLSANRTRPTRFLSPSDAQISWDGEGAAEALALDNMNEKPVLLGRVSEWYRNVTGYNLEIDATSVNDRDVCSITLSPCEGPAVKIDLEDTGEGMSQVLPVLVLVSMAAAGLLGPAPLACIEHPELHLHSRVHSELAKFLCKAIRESGQSHPSFLIETHSEAFLLQTQLAILRREIDPRNVALHWIRQEPNGDSWIDFIEFDELARPRTNNWPESVFMEAYDLSREIVAARLKAEERGR